MLKQIIRLRVVLVVLLGIQVIFSGAAAMGQNTTVTNSEDNRGNVTTQTTTTDDRGNITSQTTEVKHYYRDGRWYRRDNTGHEASILDVVVGAITGSIPPDHTTVVYDNTPYYYDNRHYYRQLPNGDYVVVEPPRR